MRISFMRKEGQAERQKNGQTDKHPKSCRENNSFGKPFASLAEISVIRLVQLLEFRQRGTITSFT